MYLEVRTIIRLLATVYFNVGFEPHTWKHTFSIYINDQGLFLHHGTRRCFYIHICIWNLQNKTSKKPCKVKWTFSLTPNVFKTRICIPFKHMFPFRYVQSVMCLTMCRTYSYYTQKMWHFYWIKWKFIISNMYVRSESRIFILFKMNLLES